MKQIIVVGAVIKDDMGYVLAALRSDRMSLPGMWEFPGGKVESGEEKNTALIREIHEELGCEIQVLEEIADVTHEYEEITVRLITYLAIIESGIPTAREHERVEWVHIKELPSYNWAPADIPTVNKLLGMIDR